MSDEQKENAAQVVSRVDQLRRGSDIADVFYALEANEISVAKALQVVRAYLNTGVIEPYGKPR